MLELFLILAMPSVWSAPWWASVGAIAAVIAALSSLAFNANKKDKKTFPTAISNSAGIFDSKFQAIGKNVRQDIVVHHHGVAPATSSENRNENRKPSRPSARKILDSIEGATPYDRHHIMAKYKDFPIAWRAKFNDMSKHYEGELWLVSLDIVSSSSDDDSAFAGAFPARVYVNLDVEANPHLKVVKSGDMCWVTGTIRIIDFPRISLQSGAVVEFD